MKKYIDVFITHAWRYHEDWLNICEIIDNYKIVEFRNFSIPWHDPGIDLHSKIGINFIEKGLKTQIYPADIFILLNSVYEIKNAKKWIELELKYAKEFDIPIIGLPNSADGNLDKYIESHSDIVISWDKKIVIDSILTSAKSSQ
jgi:hypothetical protein